MSLQSSLNTNKFFNFTGQIGDLVNNEIKVVKADCTIKKASKFLMDPAIDYLIVEENKIPIGIVSKIELLAHGMTSKKELVRPIKEIMKSQLVSVQKSDTVLDSLMFMVKHKLDYLLVMDGKISIGVITQKDWLSAQINYPIPLIKKLQTATSIRQVDEYRKEAKQLVWDNFKKEGNVISLTNIITVINDAITKRIIQLSLDKMQADGHGIPPVSFTWIGMGSEGRKAQTLITDQDNGLIFENVHEEQYDEVKNWFLTFAADVCKGLDLCGFTLCEGNIMATNPELCNSIDKWGDAFHRIIKNSDSKELLEASIYFDFRSIYGNQSLSDNLWEKLFKLFDENTFFIRHFAQNILEASRPPIKKWAWLAPEFLHITPPPFDIKREATAPLDAAIRLIALHHGISSTHTLERLEQIMEKGFMPKTLADDVKRAFDFIFRLRFRLEYEAKDVKNVDRQIHVETLIPLEVSKLKDSLKTIYKVQDYAYIHVTEHKVPWAMR